MPAAVVDAKYKAEKPAGFPNADVYQLLAYCTALRLPVGHLVYAKGNESGRVHHVDAAVLSVWAHVLDLSRASHDLLVELDRLADAVASEDRVLSAGRTP